MILFCERRKVAIHPAGDAGHSGFGALISKWSDNKSTKASIIKNYDYNRYSTQYGTSKFMRSILQTEKVVTRFVIGQVTCAFFQLSSSVALTPSGVASGWKQWTSSASSAFGRDVRGDERT
jgi:hypothetical protein